ncbi:MAG TPA: FMN-binding protein [Candidatus Paceibacterota bacterium]|nr:FMN-binding protein [Candidatus Paceibacterota bacterium]
MKKFLFSLGLVAVTAFYVLFGNQNSAPIIPPATVPATTENNPPAARVAYGGNPPSNAPAAATIQKTASQPIAIASTPTPTPTPTPKPKGLYADGSYNGSVADAYYGNVQVQAVVQGGKITDVRFLQYPDTHGTSIYINSQAMPYLTQEAIQAQSANVDIVSGATDTSMAFQQSLASALTQAKA